MPREKIKKERKKADIPKDETPNARFQRIVAHRAEVLGKTYNLITRLSMQSSYDVTQEDAQKLIEWVAEFHGAFINRYEPLAKGEKISRSGEKEISKIF